MSRCLGKEEVTVTNAAVLRFGTDFGTAISPGDAMFLRVKVQVDPVAGNSVRFWCDGTDPTATSGWVLQSGNTLDFDLEIDKLRFIAVAANAKLNLLYYKPNAGF